MYVARHTLVKQPNITCIQSESVCVCVCVHACVYWSYDTVHIMLHAVNQPVVCSQVRYIWSYVLSVLFVVNTAMWGHATMNKALLLDCLPWAGVSQ